MRSIVDLKEYLSDVVDRKILKLLGLVACMSGKWLTKEVYKFAKSFSVRSPDLKVVSVTCRIREQWVDFVNC